MQNRGVSKTLAHSGPKTYSEFWAIQNQRYTQNGSRTLSKIYDGAL